MDFILFKILTFVMLILRSIGFRSSQCSKKLKIIRSRNTAICQEFAEEQPISLHPSIKPLADSYSSFLIDQFGVIHNGSHPYQGAVNFIEELSKAGKKMVIISNSSKQKHVAVRSLKKMGFNPDFFDDIITSGDLAFEEMVARTAEPFKSLGNRCIVFGNGDDDTDYVNGMGCSVTSCAEADFVLARGNFVVYDHQGATKCDRSLESEAYMNSVLEAASLRKLPMLVTNPDIIRPGCGSPMPGVLGKKYQSMGGAVHYVGKPHSLVYEKCLQALGEAGKDRTKVCAVGDSMEHDILGAREQGIDSIFITGGVHSSELNIPQGKAQVPENKVLKHLYEKYCLYPTHAVPACEW